MRHFLLIIFCFVLLSGCKIFRSNLMLKTPRDFNYDQLVDSLSRQDYRIAPNDMIEYRVFTNNGFKLIEATTSANGTIIRSNPEIIVQTDGKMKLPLLLEVPVAGLTVVEAEKLLEQKYFTHYVDPYVQLRIVNKRVIIFPGNGGQAKVLPLANNNTTIMEAIASAGGILEDGKAYKVKLIRENPDPTKMPFVYLMDLSRIEGIMVGKSKVQAGDIIYVEPRYRPLATFNREVAPVITLITSLLILYQFTKLR